jgi:ribonuclease Y
MEIQVILVSIISFMLGCGVIYFALNKKLSSKKKEDLEEQKTIEKEITLKAQEEALKIKENAQEEAKKLTQEVSEKEKKIAVENEKLTVTKQFLEKEVKENEEIKRQYKVKEKKLNDTLNMQVEKLENIAKLSKEEAKKLILINVERKLENEIGREIAEAEEKIKTDVDEKAKQLLVEAMQHGVTDYVSEYTVSTVEIPSEDVKGRIIGKEGRNIRAFEEQTGVNLDLDEAPNMVRISSFDAVRREVAKISLQRLIQDGRIHPSRIEEVVAKTKAEIEKIMFKEGEKLCHKVGVYNLPNDLIQKLGKYKYRYSYGQNMIEHTLEETNVGVKIAHEIGANVAVVKLACLLHDIGKVFTEEEGSHIELGAEYLKKLGIKEEVVVCVEQHHQDHPSSVEGVIVQIADSISGGRPGARYEDYETYAKRMRALEETAKSFTSVNKAYAISAGRELRVIVNADKADDNAAIKLANDIAEKVQKEHTYPGTVKVTVIRETRSVGVAK